MDGSLNNRLNLSVSLSTVDGRTSYRTIAKIAARFFDHLVAESFLQRYSTQRLVCISQHTMKESLDLANCR